MASGTECKHFQGLPESGAGEFQCSILGDCSLEWYALDRCPHAVCSGCPHFEPLEFPDWEWAAAITSAPRGPENDYPYLTDVLRAADLSGFPMAESFNDHRKKYGAFGNFMRAAQGLTLLHPNASGYLILQDDTILREGCAEQVAEMLQKRRHAAVVSLYHPPELNATPSTIDGWLNTNNGWHSPGACAYAFPAWALRDLLRDEFAFWHRRFGPTGGKRCTDSIVGVWASQWGGIWFPPEPMAGHIGIISACEKPE